MRRVWLVMSAVAVVAAGVLGVSGAGGAAGSMQARWVVTDLGTLGGKESSAAAINDRGQVVGQSDTKTKGVWHAFLWQNGKMTDLGSFTGNSEANDINERGQVVGTSDTAKMQSWGDPTSHAFLWQNGKMLDLTPKAKLDRVTCYLPSGGCQAYGDLINERGQVVVSMSSNGNEALDRALLWQNGRLINLGALGKDELDETWVSAMNDRGQVVGSAHTNATDENGDPLLHAFLWQNGKMTDLGTLPGKKTSMAGSINERGQFVGDSSSTIEDIDSRCFLWQNGKMSDLGTLGGKTCTTAMINDRGQIIGWSDTKANGKHAFLWQNGTMTDLGTFGGVDSIGPINERGQILGTTVVWQNGRLTALRGLGRDTEAVAINEHNQIIGYSTTKTGKQHAVLWTLKPGS